MPVLKYTTDVSQAVNEINKLNDAAGRKSQEAIRKTADESRRLSSLQKQLLRETATAQEDYNRKLEALKGLYQKGRIDADKYREAVKKVTKEYWEARRASDDVAKSGEEAFGSEAIASVGRYVTSLAAIAGPLIAAKKAYEDLRQAERDAAAMSKATHVPIGMIRQVAETQEEFDKLKKFAEELYAVGATQTLEAGASVVFALQSAGFMDRETKQLFTELGRKGVIEDLPTLADSLKRLSSAFGRAEAGSVTQMLAKSFAASLPSPASAEKILQAATIAGGTAREEGITDEEVLAAIGIMTREMAPEEAGTRLRSFIFSTAAKGEEFKGLSVAERVKKIQESKMGTAGLLEFMGRKESVAAQTALQGNLEEFADLVEYVQKANQDREAINRKLGFRDPVREVTSLKMAEEARQKLELEESAARSELTNLLRQRATTAIQKGIVGTESVGVKAVGYAALVANTIKYKTRDWGTSQQRLLREAVESARERGQLAPEDEQLARDLLGEKPLIQAKGGGTTLKELPELPVMPVGQGMPGYDFHGDMLMLEGVLNKQLDEQKKTNQKLSEGGLVGVAE